MTFDLLYVILSLSFFLSTARTNVCSPNMAKIMLLYSCYLYPLHKSRVKATFTANRIGKTCGLHTTNTYFCRIQVCMKVIVCREIHAYNCIVNKIYDSKLCVVDTTTSRKVSQGTNFPMKLVGCNKSNVFVLRYYLLTVSC